MTARTRRDRRLALVRGLQAEHVAAAVLMLKGYRILARRYQVKGGEIDIVARRGDTIAFVEVKARPSLVEAQIAIDFGKRRRVARAARLWLVSNPWAAGMVLRGDAVFLAPWSWPRHVIAAMELTLE